MFFQVCPECTHLFLNCQKRSVLAVSPTDEWAALSSETECPVKERTREGTTSARFPVQKICSHVMPSGSRSCTWSSNTSQQAKWEKEDLDLPVRPS